LVLLLKAGRPEKFRDRYQPSLQLDQVLEMWRGALEAIRANISDPALLKATVADVLRFLPAPSGKLELTNGTTGETTLGGVEGYTDDPQSGE
jgi:hypothetical protein